MKCKHWDGCLKFDKSEGGCPTKECFETVESPETPQADVTLNDLLSAETEEKLHLAISQAVELLGRCVNTGEQEQAQTILRDALVEYADKKSST